MMLSDVESVYNHEIDGTARHALSHLLHMHVIIPTKNDEKTIPKTLQSVALQTRKPDKIWIVINGSTDQTKQIVDDFCQNSSESLKDKIQVLLYAEPLLVSGARNEAIKKILDEPKLEILQRTTISFLDADDLWSDNYLEEIEKTAKNCHEKGALAHVGIFYSDYWLLREDYLGKYGPKYPTLWTKVHDFAQKNSQNRAEQSQKKNDFLFFLRLIYNCSIGPPSTVTVTAHALQKVGYFIVSQRPFAEDLDLWIRIAHQYCLQAVGNTHTIYRIRNNSLAHHQESLWQFQMSILEIQRTWRERLLQDTQGQEQSVTHELSYTKLFLRMSQPLRLWGQAKDAKRALFAALIAHDVQITPKDGVAWLFWMAFLSLPIKQQKQLRHQMLLYKFYWNEYVGRAERVGDEFGG